MPAYTIHIDNLKLQGSHGVYAEEQLLLSPFQVDFKLYFETEAAITTLEQTANYQTLFEIIKKHFAVHHQLLEVLGSHILADIQQQFPFRILSSIKITKLNPPIAGMQGTVGVTVTS